MFRNHLTLLITFFLCSIFYPGMLEAQNGSTTNLADAVTDLKLRNIGPALMGGRIADIAVSHDDQSTWYIAVGSGGLWKTTNRGITWHPIFDDQPSYSIGTVAIDPNHAETIWVGTGENVSGRHVGWGDGIYRSDDGGKTWLQMGLTRSEHIGKLLIDPRNSKVVYAAAEGPLWSSGGERGLYRSKDRGQTWEHILEIDENTGVTDVEFDPSNPDVLYAAAYQRRRHTWSLLAGGPNSGIYKSEDGGDSWRKLARGLPDGDVGKIGLAVTPADPDLVFATIEADADEKGFYQSRDKGASWEKCSEYISGGTGPHYYQEIEASPTDPNLIYQMDVFLHISRDGGKNFDYLGTGREKHSDNHALWIDPQNGMHLIAGTDGGLYESYDQGTTWRHFPNLPISQFYKLGLDNSEPFYNIVGGAQDLGTLIGPSRTMNTEGVRNQDWYVPLGADGYDCAFDPDDPNMVYMEIQQGLLYRHDRRSEEGLGIQPQPGPSDPPERWNWDSPFLISPHNRNRLYFGSQRLWRSEDQGQSWTNISGDLTTNTNRYELEAIGRVWSVDALYDNGAMSKYATLTAISESPMIEGLLYTGSDDGVIHISENGGESWQKSERLPDLPERSFINDLETSGHDPNVVFVAADAHKFGDLRPYLFISRDRGQSWQSILGDLPTPNIVWGVKQDHINPNLLFIGTEFGLFFSPNQGINWLKLSGGVPTIPFRDLELHQRDNDLVGASFGRGFYILDDYSVLREIEEAVTAEKHELFPIRDAWWYVPNEPMQARGMPSQGTTQFVSDNPPFGAVITYYLPEVPQTIEASRHDREASLREASESIPFPGWDALFDESLEPEPQILLLVRNEKGEAVRWIKGKAEKGLHRVNWDLRLPAPDPIRLTKPAFQPPWVGSAEGPFAGPGKYEVELYQMYRGVLKSLEEKATFQVKPVPTHPAGTDFEQVTAFQKKTSLLSREISNASSTMNEISQRLTHLRAALIQTPKAAPALFSRLDDLSAQLSQLKKRLNGDPIRQRMSESTAPSIASRVGQVKSGHWGTRQKPTLTQIQNINLAEDDFTEFRQDLSAYLVNLESYEKELAEAGAPWTQGRKF